jgi:predicted metalloprotease
MANWGKISTRGDVEDRRGALPFIGGGGLVGVILFLAINLLGGSNDPTLNSVLDQLQNGQATQQQAGSEYAGADQYETFSSQVLGSNNDTWSAIFQQSGKTYVPATLVLFRTATQSGCGLAQAAVGPFYCPADQKIYLDETFFDELQKRFKAKGGDVAEAYVIAHENGHHVQNLLGIFDTVSTDAGSSGGSVKLELQADCFAGVWAHAVAEQGVLEAGEINEALDAAAAVGDDHIQEITEGKINQDTWTHGSSAERTDWFNRGYTSGKPSSCDTFGTSP